MGEERGVASCAAWRDDDPMAVPDQAPELGCGRAWSNWALGASFVVLVFALQAGYAITSASVARDLRLTIAQVGLVGTAYTWAFALAQCASGSILDRLGTRWVLPMACIIFSCGAFTFASATGLEALVAANVLVAAGASFGFIGAGFVGSQWFHPLRYGPMFSLVQFVASLSAIAAQRILGVLIQTTPWTSLISALGIIGFVLSALMLAFLRDRSTRPDTWPGLRKFAHGLVDSLAQVVSQPNTWINALIGGATMGTMLGIGVVWGPRILKAAGMQESEAFQVSSLSWAGLAVGAPAFAWVSERVRSRVKPMGLGCACQLVAIVVIMLRPSASPAEASFWFFAFGLTAGGSMLSFTVGAELVPSSLIGTSAGVVNATQFIVGGIMMAVPGRILAAVPSHTVADHQWAVAVMPATLAIALVLCVFLKETWPISRQRTSTVGAGSRSYGRSV